MQAGGNQRLLPLFFGGQLFHCRLNFCHHAHPCKLSDYLLSARMPTGLTPFSTVSRSPPVKL